MTVLVPPTTSGVPGLNLLGAGNLFPLQVIVSPLALVVLLALAGILTAVVSVILIYHWRRFQFEHETFRWAERIYLFGVLGFLAVAIFGILISA